MDLFLNINGELVDADSPIVKVRNRSFRYGDGIFETLRIVNGQLQFFDRHYSRMITSMAAIKLDVPSSFTYEFVKSEVEKIAVRNNAVKGARVRITIFRTDGGFYSPETNNFEYIIECNPMEENLFELNRKGYTIDIFLDYKKAMNRLSNIKTNNALLLVMAGIYCRQNNLDECIILNTNFSIAESVNSNIFAVKNGVLYTPPITEGCVDGVMRYQINEIAKKCKIAVYEVPLAMNVLLNSDEIFLTNAINGLRWIAAYKAKLYLNSMSKFLTDKLNDSLVQ